MSDLDDDDGAVKSSRQAGDNSQIEVFGRLRPSNKNDKTTTVLADDRRSVEFHVPREVSSGLVNNKKELYEFKMQHIFDDTATQQDIFEGIGKKVVENVLEGFNGTIFAYGQTGSGKTFTITGGPDRYEDRGLIPRTLSMIFEQKALRAASHTYNVSISYLEIYNDDGYDLLDANHDTKQLSELPKVAMFEDDAGQIHMRNIHLLPAASVDEALNLLFVGDTNRIICETPSNDASSRSHCIFTIYVESTEVGGSKIRRSKLHLVDLAGSERVKKTQIAGKIFVEACLAPSTRVLLHKGGTLEARYITPGMVVVGQRGEGVPVRAVKAMPPGAMYRLQYGEGLEHSVSAEHLVTLRWDRHPQITVDTARQRAAGGGGGGGSEFLRARIAWVDRATFRRGSASFRFRTPAMAAAAVPGACAAAEPDTAKLGAAPVLPPMEQDDARRFLALWLAELEALGHAMPLYRGDLVDLPAEQLALADEGVLRWCTLPLVSPRGEGERGAAPFSVPGATAAADTTDAAVPPVRTGASAPVLPLSHCPEIPASEEAEEVSAPKAQAELGSEESSGEEPGHTWPGSVLRRALEKMGQAGDASVEEAGLWPVAACEVPAAVAPAIAAEDEACASLAVNAAAQSRWHRAVSEAEAVLLAAGRDLPEIALFRQACLERHWLVRPGAAAPAPSAPTPALAYPLACEAFALPQPATPAPAAVEFVYMLPSAYASSSGSSSVPLVTGKGERSFALSQLERAWDELGVDAAAGNTLLCQMDLPPPAQTAAAGNPADGACSVDRHEALCLASMAAAVALEPRAIVAFGHPARQAWLALFPRLARVSSGTVDMHGMALRMRSGKTVRVVFGSDPSVGLWLGDVKQALSRAHGLGYPSPSASASSASAASESGFVPLRGITRLEGEHPSIAIEVASPEKRLVLGDGALTHNCAINLALHYLEQVIVALHKRTRDKSVHIPYRNSMMTSVLRDSLGGNCKTVMIATMSAQRGHIDESISTCRFAARVAMVRNAAYVNEELDPKLLVRRLKAQVRELREELAAARGEKALDRPCDEDELERCRALVAEYASTAEPAPLESGMPNPRKVEACFAVWKEMLIAAQNAAAAGGAADAVVAVGGGGGGGDPAAAGVKGSRRLHPSVIGGGAGGGGVVAVAAGGGGGASEVELRKLRLTLSSRENEIAILLSMLREALHVPAQEETTLLQQVRDRAAAQARRETGLAGAIHDSGAVQQSLLASKGIQAIQSLHTTIAPELRGASVAQDALLLRERLASFEDFRRSYRRNQLMEEQKDSLKAKIEAAQRLGEAINAERNRINHAKQAVEQRRIQRGVAALSPSSSTPDSDASAPDAEEEALLSQIEQSKAKYRSHFQGLKDLKAEIEHLKGMVDRSRRKLQADFDTWWAEQQALQGQGQAAGAAARTATPAAQVAQQYPGGGAPLSSRGRSGPYSSSSASPSPSPLSPSPSASPPASSQRAPYPYPSSATGGGGAAGLISSSLAAASPSHAHASSFSSGGGGGGGGGGGASYAPSSSQSHRPSASPSSSPSPSPPAAAVRLPSTGNAQADADIQKFYEMRDSLMRQQQQQQQANAAQRR